MDHIGVEVRDRPGEILQ